MTPTTDMLLIVAAAIPIACGVVAVLAAARGMRTVALIFGQIGFAGGTVCGFLLAGLLKGGSNGAEIEIQWPGWTWFSFPGTYGPTVKFGLAATWAKSLALGIGGMLALATTWKADSPADRRLSDHALMAATLLFGFGTIFLFAPNAVQGFIGWAAVSLMAAVLLRLSRHQIKSTSVQTVRVHRADLSPTRSGIVRLLEGAGSLIIMVERLFGRPNGETVFKRLTVWTAEQLDLLSASPLSTQLIVAVLGTFAVLLSWLM